MPDATHHEHEHPPLNFSEHSRLLLERIMAPLYRTEVAPTPSTRTGASTAA